MPKKKARVLKRGSRTGGNAAPKGLPKLIRGNRVSVGEWEAIPESEMKGDDSQVTQVNPVDAADREAQLNRQAEIARAKAKGQVDEETGNIIARFFNSW